MTAPLDLPPHPKYGMAAETYEYWRDDGRVCVQAKYRNGVDGPKHCAWWVQADNGEYFTSYGDVKLERLQPFNSAAISNPHVRHEPIILTEGPRDASALAGLGFIASDHRALVAAHAPWFKDRDVVIIADRDPPSSATNGGGYCGHVPGKYTPGERAATRAKRTVAPIARRLTVVTMPGDGIKDAAQWCAAHPGSREEKASSASFSATRWRAATAPARSRRSAAAASSSTSLTGMTCPFRNANGWCPAGCHSGT